MEASRGWLQRPLAAQAALRLGEATARWWSTSV